MYAKINNNTVVSYPVDVRWAHPNTSFPDGWPGGAVEGQEYAYVHPVTRPTTTHGQNCFEDTPIFLDGRWIQTWNVTDASTETINSRIAEKWAEIRRQRNSLLSLCDWTHLADSPLSVEKKTEWQVYRQDLRDITEQADPFNLTWPIKPS